MTALISLNVKVQLRRCVSSLRVIGFEKRLDFRSDMEQKRMYRVLEALEKILSNSGGRKVAWFLKLRKNRRLNFLWTRLMSKFCIFCVFSCIFWDVVGNNVVP